MNNSTRPALLRAIAFDAYGTLFDVYSVGALAEQLFPGKGAELAALWRDRQIDYTRLRTLSNRYVDFWQVTRDALRFACARLALPLDEAAEKKLMAQYASLSAFPENLDALRALKALGLPLAILSNGTPRMLDIAIKSAGMSGLFDHVLSADSVRQYKTAAAVYELGPAAFGLPARQILFVSSNAWDACGAAWFGFTSFWINRSGQPPEALDVAPAATGRLLTDVVSFVSPTTISTKETP
jgi:2-haloacid dehalogenase